MALTRRHAKPFAAKRWRTIATFGPNSCRRCTRPYRWAAATVPRKAAKSFWARRWTFRMQCATPPFTPPCAASTPRRSLIALPRRRRRRRRRARRRRRRRRPTCNSWSTTMPSPPSTKALRPWRRLRSNSRATTRWRSATRLSSCPTPRWPRATARTRPTPPERSTMRGWPTGAAAPCNCPMAARASK